MADSACGAARQVHQHHGCRTLCHDGRARSPQQLGEGVTLDLLAPPSPLFPSHHPLTPPPSPLRHPCVLVSTAPLLLLGQCFASPSLPGPVTWEVSGRQPAVDAATGACCWQDMPGQAWLPIHPPMSGLLPDSLTTGFNHTSSSNS